MTLTPQERRLVEVTTLDVMGLAYNVMAAVGRQMTVAEIDGLTRIFAQIADAPDALNAIVTDESVSADEALWMVREMEAGLQKGRREGAVREAMEAVDAAKARLAWAEARLERKGIAFGFRTERLRSELETANRRLALAQEAAEATAHGSINSDSVTLDMRADMP